MRFSRPCSPTPTASGKTLLGKACAKSSIASKRSARTSRSTSARASASNASRRDLTRLGDSTPVIALRACVWAGGSASSSRLGGRNGVSLVKSARPTPAAERNVSQSFSAAATCSWRAIPQIP
jgi:hypothetical protein